MKGFSRPLISIIVPVYNADKYIRECVESILSQSYDNFQLILVDDGSTDSSANICDEYADTCQNVTTIHQDNAGVTFARKQGLSVALGEYICFCDADDYMYQHSLQTMVDAFDDGIEVVVANVGKDAIISCCEYVNDLLRNVLPWGPWAKMFNRRLFDARTLEIPRYFNVGEDLLMQLNIAQRIKGRIKCINEELYVLRSNPDSVTQNRAYSVEYESRFVSEVISYTHFFPFDVSASIFRIRMNSLKMLIKRGVPVSYDDGWVKKLREDYKKYPTTLLDKFVLFVSYNRLCQFILLLRDVI